MTERTIRLWLLAATGGVLLCLPSRSAMAQVDLQPPSSTLEGVIRSMEGATFTTVGFVNTASQFRIRQPSTTILVPGRAAGILSDVEHSLIIGGLVPKPMVDPVLCFDIIDTPRLTIEDLIVQVNGLIGAALSRGQANALNAKLEAALQALNDGHGSIAIRQLQAFINQVGGLVNGGVLAPTEGHLLIDAAQIVINQLGT